MGALIEPEVFEGTLVVHPEILRKKSREVLVRIKEMKADFEMMGETAERTRSYWLGDAGTLSRAYMTNRKPEVEEMLLRMMEHVKELEHMAAVYVKAEQESEKIANELPADVIV